MRQRTMPFSSLPSLPLCVCIIQPRRLRYERSPARRIQCIHYIRRHNCESLLIKVSNVPKTTTTTNEQDKSPSVSMWVRASAYVYCSENYNFSQAHRAREIKIKYFQLKWIKSARRRCGGKKHTASRDDWQTIGWINLSIRIKLDVCATVCMYNMYFRKLSSNSSSTFEYFPMWPIVVLWIYW